MRLRFCGDRVRASTTDGATTNDARPAKTEERRFDERVDEAFKRPNGLYELGTEVSRKIEEARQRLGTVSPRWRAQTEKELEEAEGQRKYLNWLTWDSAATPGPYPLDESSLLAAINRANAEHYARQGAAIPVEPIDALPANPTPGQVNQRNAGYWRGAKQ